MLFLQLTLQSLTSLHIYSGLSGHSLTDHIGIQSIHHSVSNIILYHLFFKSVAKVAKSIIPLLIVKLQLEHGIIMCSIIHYSFCNRGSTEPKSY